MVKKNNIKKFFVKNNGKSLFGAKKSKFKGVSLKQPNNKKYLKLKIYLIIFTIIFLMIIGIAHIVTNTIYLPKYNIQQVNFSEKTLAKENNPYLFKDIKNEIIGENYYIISKLKIKSLEAKIKDKYPTVKSLKIFFVSDQNVGIDIEFHKPNLVFKTTDGYLGSRNGYLFDIFSGSEMLSGMEFIQLPEYLDLSDEDSLNGFYFLTKEKDLSFQIAEIKDFIGRDKIESILYLPGGGKTIVKTTNEKTIFFDNTKSISNQIDKLLSLKNNYGEYDKIKQIDLGSMDSIIIKQ